LAELQLKLDKKIEQKKGRIDPVLPNNDCSESRLDLSFVDPVPSFDRSTKPSLLSFNDRTDILRKVIIPQSLVEKFVLVAKKNTDLNVETLAILAGRLGQNAFTITHLLVPKQRGTADSCEMYNEEEVSVVQDKNDLIIIGWIHTHPTQNSFMSSVDLHNHYSYQLMLPESIAIVCAPKFGQTGIFSLTEPYGMQLIANCKMVGFHPHPTDPPIYDQSSHLVMDQTIQVNLIDLR